MKDVDVLERRYRRLLRLLPRPEREARGDEMLGVLLDRAAPGQRWPSAGDSLDLLTAATRSRLRLLLVIDPVARLGALGAVVLLLLAATLAVGVLHARGSLGAAVPTSGPVLPDRFPNWKPKPVMVAQGPAGPASMAYVDGSEDTEEFVVVLGADGSTARRLPLTDDRRIAYRIGPALLSPDGRHVAQSEVGGIVLTDLLTGARRTLRDPAVEVHSEPLPLAWSADSARIAVQSGPLTALLSTAGGRTVTLPGGATSAAFAPDGRLALAASTALEVYAADSTLLGQTERPEGWQIAPAGWSRDVLAMSSRDDDDDSGTTLPDGDPGLRVAAHGAVPALLGSPGRSEPLGWQSADLLVEAGGSLVRWDPSALRSEPMTGLDSDWFKGQVRLATGLMETARTTPLGHLDRGPVPPGWLLAAVAVGLVPLLLGWGYPATHVRLRTLSTRAAISTVGDHADMASWLVLGASPVLFLGWAFYALEPLLMLAVLGLVGGSAYALGRSLGRARYVTGRTAAWTTGRRATG